MPVTSIVKDPEALTMTVVAEFGVPVRRLWDAYLDPRMIERFWGPPDCPTVFTRHDGYVGGRSEWVMHVPDGEPMHFSWVWVAIDEFKSFEARDGDGPPITGPERMVFTFEPTATGSRLSVATYFETADEMTKALEMDMEEGAVAGAGLIEATLADLGAFAVGNGTMTQILTDTKARVSRVIRGSVDAVWRAHQDPALLKQWLLGPDGWTMPVCEVAAEVGQSYRYEWEKDDGTARFGFTGELLVSAPPHRSVVTESMIGVDGEPCTNDLTLTAVEDGTLLSIVVTFPTADVRDAVLATGMADGMEASYTRLDALLT